MNTYKKKKIGLVWVLFIALSSLLVPSFSQVTKNEIFEGLTFQIPTKTLNNGYEVPSIGFAAIESVSLREVVYKSIKMGYRLIDTVYNERTDHSTGEMIRHAIRGGIVKRKDLFITSKLWNTFHRPQNMLSIIEDTLHSLKIDYLDLYVVHWPMAFTYRTAVQRWHEPFFREDDVTIEETWQGMEELVRLNYTRSIGVANFNVSQLKRITKIAKIQPAVLMTELNPYMIDHELINYCHQNKIVIFAEKPSYSGKVLAAQQRDVDMQKEPLILELAKKYKKTTHQICMRFVLQLDAIPIKLGLVTKELQYNLDIFNFKLTDEEMKAIEKLNLHIRSIRFDSCLYFREYPFTEYREIAPNIF